MYWIDTTGNGSISAAGDRGSDPYAMNGSAVMYAPGQILTIGGAPAYDDGQATSDATVIDLNGPTVTTRTVSPMDSPRGMHNSVVLPNGEVVVIGGLPVTTVFSDTDAVYRAEIWNPQTESFRQVAAMAVPRTYHSISLLLADGRVLVGGGGLCGNCSANHPDVQIFTPPYLLNSDGSDATRPQLTSAPSTIDLGEFFAQGTAGEKEYNIGFFKKGFTSHHVTEVVWRIPFRSES